MDWCKTPTSVFLLMILVLGDNMVFPISPCLADSGNQSVKGHAGSVSTMLARKTRAPTQSPPRQRPTACHK